ncbi:MAG: hypothetical protein IGS03_06590 [Candidatus Sericytochromatia bacterium]|nr:hypothetical protein [Candidatus Sericytochromatia bacterium]
MKVLFCLLRRLMFVWSCRHTAGFRGEYKRWLFLLRRWLMAGGSPAIMAKDLLQRTEKALAHPDANVHLLFAQYLLCEVHRLLSLIPGYDYNKTRAGNAAVFPAGLDADFFRQERLLHQVVVTRMLHQGIDYLCYQNLTIDSRGKPLLFIKPFYITLKPDTWVLTSLDYEVEVRVKAMIPDMQDLLQEQVISAKELHRLFGGASRPKAAV